jgi:hypothetical protein
MLNKHRLVGLGVCMGLACGVKIFAILLLPFLLRFEWKAWLAFSSTLVLLGLPFGIEEAWFPAGLSAMGSSWLFNAPLYILADYMLGSSISLTSIKLSLLSVFAIASGAYLIYYLKKGPNVVAHLELRGDFLFIGLLLCAPVFNPWYLVWLLPFAVFRPSAWAWILSVTVLLSYASGINLSETELEPYQHWGGVLALEFIPPLIALITTCLVTRCGLISNRGSQPKT